MRRHVVAFVAAGITACLAASACSSSGSAGKGGSHTGSSKASVFVDNSGSASGSGAGGGASARQLKGMLLAASDLPAGWTARHVTATSPVVDLCAGNGPVLADQLPARARAEFTDTNQSGRITEQLYSGRAAQVRAAYQQTSQLPATCPTLSAGSEAMRFQVLRLGSGFGDASTAFVISLRLGGAQGSADVVVARKGDVLVIVELAGTTSDPGALTRVTTAALNRIPA
jgi:hypothetical protein